jgi:peptidoglycan hydrolase-like protein with peptidoglycan-binding domain
MTIELGLLFLILLQKAQKLFGTPAQAASQSQQEAATAAAAAAAAAQRGDHQTAATKAQEAAQHAQAAAAQAKAAKTPPPWPQVVPAGLPAFPSPAWKPASPVTSAMVTRAFQLLAQLWSSGAGTYKVEKTGPQWVVYQAAPTRAADGSTRNGVVAYTTSQPSAQASTNTITVTPGFALPPAGGGTVPAAFNAKQTHPVLRLGSAGPSVVWVQQQLHVTADGKFGPATAAAVRNFQARHGMAADGVVGPQTWAALGGSAQAA